MRLLFLEGFSAREAAAFREPIFSNLFRNMATVASMAQKWEYPFDNEDNSRVASSLQGIQYGADTELTPESGKELERLWKDSAIVKAVERSNEYSLDDAHPYYMEHVLRLSARDYVPTTDDILRCRIKTLGIHEIEFQCSGMDFQLVDVGGQRTERRKWIHCFDNVTILLYVAALSEYDLFCEEDEKSNRMVESLELFKSITNNVYFQKTPVVLFFNKVDLFKEKIPRVPFSKHVPDYKGDDSYDDVLAYIQKRFDSMNESPASVRPVYRHVTCATDTDQIHIVWRSVSDVLLNDSMKDAGFRHGI